jgi:hypothetical protein
MAYFFRRALAGAALFAAAATADASTVTASYWGETRYYNDGNAVISAHMQGDNVYISVHGDDTFSFSTVLAAPRGERLRRGSFYNAERAPFRTGRAPGVDGGYYGGCNETTGGFDVRQVVIDEWDQVLTLDATVVFDCYGYAEGWRTIVIKYKALPWYFSYNSPAGDPLGGGLKHTFLGHTSDMALVGTPAGGFDYAVSGEREEWNVEFVPPTGQLLAAGKTYTANTTGGGGAARLRVTGRTGVCDVGTGSITVFGLKTSAAGKITALNASFSLSCDGQPPFKGTIRYYL